MRSWKVARFSEKVTKLATLQLDSYGVLGAASGLVLFKRRQQPIESLAIPDS